MEVSIVNKQQTICADFCYEDRNCSYAKVVEEHGEYPVITFQAKEKNGSPDLTTAYNVKRRVDTTCWCVYCTHPSYSKEKFIGSVEPYFPCKIPSDCPLQKQCESATNKKPSLLDRVKSFFVK